MKRCVNVLFNALKTWLTTCTNRAVEIRNCWKILQFKMLFSKMLYILVMTQIFQMGLRNTFQLGKNNILTYSEINISATDVQKVNMYEYYCHFLLKNILKCIIILSRKRWEYILKIKNQKTIFINSIVFAITI